MHDDLDKEYRAWELLRWSTPAALADFDEALADAGFYTSVQQKRSDQAFDAWEQENIRPTTELDAFRELVSLGVFTEQDFYSPAKSKTSHYSRTLNEHKRQQQSQPMASGHEASWKEHAQVCVTTYPEAEWMAAMRNQAACLDLSFDVKDTRSGMSFSTMLRQPVTLITPGLPGQQVSHR